MKCDACSADLGHTRDCATCQQARQAAFADAGGHAIPLPWEPSALAAGSLLRPATPAPAAPRVDVTLRPIIRYPDGRSRPATDAEWQEFKRQWGRPATKL